MAESRWKLTKDEERDVLNFDPWGERDATYRVIREGFCVVRSEPECAICLGPIHRGERVWFRAEQDDGRMATFRFCPECCWCIAHRYDEHYDDSEMDPWGRMYARWELGSSRSRERQHRDEANQVAMGRDSIPANTKE